MMHKKEKDIPNFDNVQVPPVVEESPPPLNYVELHSSDGIIVSGEVVNSNATSIAQLDEV